MLSKDCLILRLPTQQPKSHGQLRPPTQPKLHRQTFQVLSIESPHCELGSTRRRLIARPPEQRCQSYHASQPPKPHVRQCWKILKLCSPHPASAIYPIDHATQTTTGLSLCRSFV